MGRLIWGEGGRAEGPLVWLPDEGGLGYLGLKRVSYRSCFDRRDGGEEENEESVHYDRRGREGEW